MDQACPVCGCYSTPSSVEGLWRCQNCTHLFQHPLEVTKQYNYEYVHNRYDSYGTTDLMSHLRLGFVRAVQPRCSRLLDVGYGNGSFLKLAQKAGYDVYGNDVHGCGEKFGIREVSLNGAAWDVVTFFDSLEHFSSLELPRKVCQRALAVVISVPCLPDREEDIPAWKHYRPGEHLHYFTERSLAEFMGAKVRVACLDLEDAVRGDRQGDWNIMTSAYVESPCVVESL
jgi:SAM-dependent methyltransferase